jgi:hypothetical protein
MGGDGIEPPTPLRVKRPAPLSVVSRGCPFRPVQAVRGDGSCGRLAVVGHRCLPRLYHATALSSRSAGLHRQPHSIRGGVAGFTGTGDGHDWRRSPYCLASVGGLLVVLSGSLTWWGCGARMTVTHASSSDHIPSSLP